jgi:hypothetical protein
MAETETPQRAWHFRSREFFRLAWQAFEFQGSDEVIKRLASFAVSVLQNQRNCLLELIKVAGKSENIKKGPFS